jgi:hypothetical protein
MAVSLRDGLREVLTNKVDISQLRVGDHIYSWRNLIYAHHGELLQLELEPTWSITSVGPS